MKSWEPERIFGKADFPIKEKDADRQKLASAPGKEKSKENSNPEKKPEYPDQKEQSQGKPSVEESQGKRPPQKELKFPSLPKSASAWSPDLEFASADFSHNLRTGRSQAAAPEASGSLKSREEQVQFQRKLLARFIRQHTIPSLHALRSLFFQKNASSEQIHPHDKIALLLASLDQSTLQYLLSVMSPAERKNMFALIKSRRINMVQASSAIQSFMQSVQQAM